MAGPRDLIDEIVKPAAKAVKKVKKVKKKANAPLVDNMIGTEIDLSSIKTMQDVPEIRTIPIDQALAIARQEPHLIAAGKGSGGAFIGGPRNIQSKSDLERMREELDAYIYGDIRGADWYDRYRRSVNEVTGGDPNENMWMSNIEGMYSAQASPETELNFALRDSNSAIAYGLPTVSKTGSQNAASIRAIEGNDPWLYQLGKKTGEYARRINPDQPGFEKATGVNDFRHLRNLGYTEVSGEDQIGAVGAAGHKFADYETALAVDRANQQNLGGLLWTGERLQAAPWVRQKGEDFYDRYTKRYDAEAADMLGIDMKNATPDQIARIKAKGLDIATDQANATIGDYFDKHTAFATYEAQPYAGSGQLPGLLGAPEDVRSAFANDPLSTWANAPGGRDAIYSGMALESPNTALNDRRTGNAMRVRPTVEMQGVYTPPSGATEFNPGEVARPLVSFEGDKVKTMPAADQGLLNLGEGVRAYIDTQGAGAWHKPWLGGRVADSNSVFVSRGSQKAATPDELKKISEIANKYGLSDVIDTGSGFTLTKFGDDKFVLGKKQLEALGKELEGVGDYKAIDRVNIDSGYAGYEGTWEQGVGSGAATRQLFKYIDGAPAYAVEAIDKNPYIAQNALNRLARDAEASKTLGATRKDIENARKIIGDGPGWVGRLRSALEQGQLLPAIGVTALGPYLYSGEER